MSRLEFGEDLSLLRATLPVLGGLLALAGIAGHLNGRLDALAGGVVTLLGVAATLWSLRMTTRRVSFDAATRRVEVRLRQGARRSVQSLAFDEVRDVVVRVLEGYRGDTDSPLGRTPSLALDLVTSTGRFPLTPFAEPAIADCETQDRAIHAVLGRTPDGTLLERSYRHALAGRDRLQAIQLCRLLHPALSLTEAEARVRQEMPPP